MVPQDNLVLRTNLSGPHGTPFFADLLPAGSCSSRKVVKGTTPTDAPGSDPARPVDTKVFLFPDGSGETVTVFRAPRSDVMTEDRRNQLRLLGIIEENHPESEEDAAARQAENEARAAKRAKSQCRRFAKQNQLTHMVTLTFPGAGVHDYDKAYAILRGWMKTEQDVYRVDDPLWIKRIRSGRECLPGHYLTVPEKHPGGHGLHWHILIGRELTGEELALLRRSWTYYLKRFHGMTPTGGATWARVNIKRFYPRKGQTAVGAAASYASKYVSKSMRDGGAVPAGRKRYLCSLDGQPIPALVHVGDHHNILRLVAELRGGDITGYWFDSDTCQDWDVPARVIVHIWDA